MGMLEWAKKEIEIVKKREKKDEPERVFSYGALCYASALRAFESLAKDGHSGMSIGFTKQILKNSDSSGVKESRKVANAIIYALRVE